MKRLVLILILILSLTACSAQTESEQTDTLFKYSFVDDAGKTVTLTKRPENAAILFSSFADIWKTAGGTTAVSVGESVERGFAGENVILVDSGSGHNALDLETLIASKPDFVVGTLDYDGQRDTCALTSQSGIPSALFRVESFEDYLRVLKIFTDITGKPENYELYGAQIEKQISVLPESTSHPTVLFIRAGSSAKSTKAKTASGHFACVMLEKLGCVNIADSAPVLLDGLSLEEIILQNPEYILVVPMGDEQSAKDYIGTLFTKDGWSALDAVKNGKVAFLPKDLFHYKPNARWAQAYEYLINLLF